MVASSDSEFRYDRVVFDVGGTLLGLFQPEPFQEFLAQAGLPASAADAKRFHRQLIANLLSVRDAAQGLGADGGELDGWWHDIFAATLPDQPDLASEMMHWLKAGCFDRLFPDVLPALAALRDLGMPLAVLSNFGTHLRAILDRSDLSPFFDFMVVSAEVGLAKPDPRIFELVASQAAVPPGRLLYVGDHVGDDIDGARGAGWEAVLIDRRHRHPQATCSRISSLLELVDYIRPPVWPARAIILDMDGVVLDSPPLHALTWQRTLAPLGVDMTAGDLYPLEGMPTEHTAQRLTEILLGQPCSEEQARELAATKRALFRELFTPTFVPGIVPLLHDLRGRGYRLALVTGSAQSVVDESLAPSGLVDMFDIIVTGDRVTHGKPHPEPYRTAAAQLGLPPAQCLAVENAPLGIQSARRAGMQCVALETTLPARQLQAAAPQHVFPEVAALRAWLLPVPSAPA
ncbi:MAG: HAD-IA family hydrolase [Anaerolineae bacterium]|jgi:HAD superfamily hydrolase (TIGR01509 family)